MRILRREVALNELIISTRRQFLIDILVMEYPRMA
jgi:hypothetical protein